MPLEIRPVESKKELEAFLHVPWTLGMKSDPNWVPPLLDDYRRSLNPKKSPFLKHGEVKCFLALQDGMPHNRPYLGPLIESAGLAKAKDFYAWWYTSGHIDERTRKIAERTLQLPNVRVRPMDLSHFRREVDIVRDIYNSAWSQNWNFTPFTSDELEIMATEYKVFVDTEIALIAEVDGKPAAMCFAIPDVNEMVKDFDGELTKNPLNLARLLWRLKFRRPKHARLLLP